MSHLRTLVWYFYKPLLLWNQAFSFVYIGLISVYGPKIIGYGFFFKILGYASATFLQSHTAKNVYMYYRNAGYSIKRMYAYTYALDLIIYILMLSLYLLIR